MGKNAQKIICAISGHRWVETVDDMRGVTKAVRTCERCSAAETYMYDFQLEEYTWVKGTYMQVGAPIFVVAATHSCYQDRAEELHRVYPERSITWLQTDRDFTMMRRSTHWPDIRLAADWAEADIIWSLTGFFTHGYV